jgi:predicted GNAT family N-acyltransferase
LTVTVRPIRDEAELEAARDLRVRVFCGEQGVDASEELDELDRVATHVIGLDESGVIATCRIRELREGEWKLERMVVEKRLRNSGVGARLLAGAEAEALGHGGSEMVLHAQRRAESFYAGNGYVAEGDTFVEAEIEHVRMRKALDG